MIACDHCKLWFHKDCMCLDVTKSYKDVPWVCGSCSSMIAHVMQ